MNTTCPACKNRFKRNDLVVRVMIMRGEDTSFLRDYQIAHLNCPVKKTKWSNG